VHDESFYYPRITKATKVVLANLKVECKILAAEVER
jgi:hypothetical protein